jgi:hypothetical protein
MLFKSLPEKVFFFVMIAPAVLFLYLMDKLGFESHNDPTCAGLVISVIFWTAMVLAWIHCTPWLSIGGLVVPTLGYYIQREGL